MRTENDFKLLQGLSLEMKIKKANQRIKEFVEEYGQKNIMIVNKSQNKDNNKVLVSIIDELGYEIKEFSKDKVTNETALIIPVIAYNDYWVEYWCSNGCNDFDSDLSMPLLTWTQKDIDNYIKNYIIQL